SSRIDPETGELVGNADLGIELDIGAQYTSGDGFLAGVAYGVLFPLSGLDNYSGATLDEAQTAQTVRGWFGIVY
ncbi:MAG TPA: TIGR04551 family protein, partial [Myxococcales bacterium]|nr:TIGR04551 family protein [Myxococcales bacterium]